MPLDCEKIRKRRESLGLNQDEAAAKAGFTNKQAWSQIESGRRTNITLDTLEAVAKALGVKAKDLLK